MTSAMIDMLRHSALMVICTLKGAQVQKYHKRNPSRNIKKLWGTQCFIASPTLWYCVSDDINKYKNCAT